MIDSGKKITSFILGVLTLAIGLFPLLAKFNVITFNIPGLDLFFSIAFWIFAAGGIFLLIDAHLEDHTLKVPTTIVAIILIVIGLIEILNSFGVVPFTIPFANEMFFYVLFIIEGLFLIIAAFAV